MKEKQALKIIDYIVADTMEYYAEESKDFFRGMVCAIGSISDYVLEGEKDGQKETD